MGRMGIFFILLLFIRSRHWTDWLSDRSRVCLLVGERLLWIGQMGFIVCVGLAKWLSKHWLLSVLCTMTIKLNQILNRQHQSNSTVWFNSFNMSCSLGWALKCCRDSNNVRFNSFHAGWFYLIQEGVSVSSSFHGTTDVEAVKSSCLPPASCTAHELFRLSQLLESLKVPFYLYFKLLWIYFSLHHAPKIPQVCVIIYLFSKLLKNPAVHRVYRYKNQWHEPIQSSGRIHSCFIWTHSALSSLLQGTQIQKNVWTHWN